MDIVETKNQNEENQDNTKVFANMINDGYQIESNKNKEVEG